MLGEDGSGGTGGGLIFSPGTRLLAAPPGGREWVRQVESLPRSSLLLAGGVPRAHLKVSGPSCVFSQHENARSLMQ